MHDNPTLHVPNLLTYIMALLNLSWLMIFFGSYLGNILEMIRIHKLQDGALKL